MEKGRFVTEHYTRMQAKSGVDADRQMRAVRRGSQSNGEPREPQGN